MVPKIFTLIAILTLTSFSWAESLEILDYKEIYKAQPGDTVDVVIQKFGKPEDRHIDPYYPKELYLTYSFLKYYSDETRVVKFDLVFVDKKYIYKRPHKSNFLPQERSINMNEFDSLGAETSLKDTIRKMGGPMSRRLAGDCEMFVYVVKDRDWSSFVVLLFNEQDKLLEKRYLYIYY